eukprot:TRINITY_DN4848_c0_g1_i5.p1 TRINITY_DN4848_c0_g1~~TRINITY_DN4848_c0_g1_i5.p1  ORF type:complete len:314 (-),score=89.72 TRINITY_DN4848_c0_g1_i5:70-1011(-)
MKTMVRFGVLSTLTVFIAFLHVVVSKRSVSSNVVWAVDCGSSKKLRAKSGFVYQGDIGHSANSKVSDYSGSDDARRTPFRFTDEPNVYYTERHADGSFTYHVALKDDGNYVLNLKFAEMWFQEEGKRVFNIKIGDTRVVKDLDVFAKVGRFAAHNEWIPLELRKKQLFFQGKAIKGGVEDSGQFMEIKFEQGKADNPMVDAIVVFKGTLSDTDYAHQERLRTHWNDFLLEKEHGERLTKLKEKRRERNDVVDVEVEAEFEEVVEGVDAVGVGLFHELSKHIGVCLATIVSFIVLILNALYGGKVESSKKLKVH